MSDTHVRNSSGVFIFTLARLRRDESARHRGRTRKVSPMRSAKAFRRSSTTWRSNGPGKAPSIGRRPRPSIWCCSISRCRLATDWMCWRRSVPRVLPRTGHRDQHPQWHRGSRERARRRGRRLCRQAVRLRRGLARMRSLLRRGRTTDVITTAGSLTVDVVGARRLRRAGTPMKLTTKEFAARIHRPAPGWRSSRGKRWLRGRRSGRKQPLRARSTT